MTVNDYVVRYQEHVSTKSYGELVAAFEEVAERHIAPHVFTDDDVVDLHRHGQCERVSAAVWRRLVGGHQHRSK